ncbi:MAG: GGDEF domain-containing protein [Desulfurivibrio sp.]|nr:GGDEF domain-containing protein [Desulfurivibrio sp.]
MSTPLRQGYSPKSSHDNQLSKPIHHPDYSPCNSFHGGEYPGAFSSQSRLRGILVTDNGRYQGFLNANALLKLLSDKNLEEARNQNPLTRLPGNFLINRFISDALGDLENEYIYVYFDFDNFKPFNDKYGLRQGDRAILMFADILEGNGQHPRMFRWPCGRG